jgi:hypothetical protein
VLLTGTVYLDCRHTKKITYNKQKRNFIFTLTDFRTLLVRFIWIADSEKDKECVYTLLDAFLAKNKMQAILK